MTEDGYELFTFKNSPFAPGLQVSIQAHRNMTFNLAVYEALGKPAAVQLLYNRERRSVGLRAADPDAPGAFRVRKQERSFSYVFSAFSFLNYYDLKEDRARRFNAELHGDMITFDLDKGVPVARRGGKRHESVGAG